MSLPQGQPSKTPSILLHPLFTHYKSAITPPKTAATAPSIPQGLTTPCPFPETVATPEEELDAADPVPVPDPTDEI